MDIIDKVFKVTHLGSNIKTEIIAGLTTFLTMVYIIVVNPAILSNAGMDKGSVFIATILISAISTIIMGLFANLPIALAPGMGLNAFFTFIVVLKYDLSWQIALFAVFCSGVLFLIITSTSLRQHIISAIPPSLKIGIGTGIGFFLLFIGLQNAGIIVANPATITGIGNLKEPTVILACIGFLTILILEARKVKGALIISILFVTILSFIFTDSAYQGLLGGIPEYQTFMKLDFDFTQLLSAQFLIIIFSLLFVDFFDSTGTIIAISQSIQTDRSSNILKSNKPLLVDSFATVLGSILGTSTATVYIESATGVRQGGKTGLTAVVVGILFLLCLFLYPLVSAIPSYATAPALIYIGFLFIQNLRDLDLHNIQELIPAGVSAILIPFTFSISHGIIFGFLTYLVISLASGKTKEIPLTVWIISLLSVVYLVFA